MTKTTIVALVTALCMIIPLAPSTGAAASVSSSNSVAGAAARAAGESTAAAASKLERFVQRSADGTLVFRQGTSPKAAGVSTQSFRDIRASMTKVNALVESGYLQTTKSLDVYATKAAYSLQSVGSAWYWKWWGVEVHLSAYWTNKLISALNVGAGIAGAAAVLCGATGVCGVVAGIIGAFVAIGAGIIGFCSNSRGVVLKKTYAGPGWCQGH